MPTPKLLASLPPPEEMKRRLRVLSMLDSMLAPDFRAFEFHPKWSKGEQMGAFKDGSGNFFFAWFSPKGTVIRGFDHESGMSPFQHEPPKFWPGLFDGLPKSLAYANQEPAFALEELTFLVWNTGDGWETSAKVKLPKKPDPDGAVELLRCLTTPLAKFAPDYFGEKLHAKSLAALETEAPLTLTLVKALNRDADLDAVKAEAKDLGWKWA